MPEEVVAPVTPVVETPVNEVPKADPMIPKVRFDEVNSKYKEMADKVAAFEKAETDRQAAQEQVTLDTKKKQGEFEDLYNGLQKELDTYKVYEERTKSLETVITSMVETKLAAISEDLHDLVPSNLTAEQTLDWLNKAESKGIFGKAEPKDIGKPSNQTNTEPKLADKKLSALDKILAGLGN